MKIEKYLNSISKKEFIYILISMPIIFFVIYFNFIYPDLEKNKKREKNKIIQKEHKIKKLTTEIKKVKISKNIIKPTRKKLENLMEDYKFIKYNMDTIKILYLNDPKTFLLLQKILKQANILHLNTSINVEWIEPSKLFQKGVKVNISGKGKFINIIKYLQYIEHLKALVSIQNVNIYVQSQKNLFSYLKEKTKKSSISVILSRYSNRDIEYLKNYAKTHNLNVSISMYGLDSIKMYFSGNYQNILNLNKILKSMQQTKKIKITNKKVHIYKPQTFISNKSHMQNFEFTFIIMGAK